MRPEKEERKAVRIVALILVMLALGIWIVPIALWIKIVASILLGASSLLTFLLTLINIQ